MTRGGLTVAEVGERWPEALVLWDRDVAPLGWDPAFRLRGTPPDEELWADDLECPDRMARAERRGGAAARLAVCRCVMWDGQRWLSRIEAEQRHFTRDARELARNRVDPDRVWRPERVRSMHNFIMPAGTAQREVRDSEASRFGNSAGNSAESTPTDWDDPA